MGEVWKPRKPYLAPLLLEAKVLVKVRRFPWQELPPQYNAGMPGENFGRLSMRELNRSLGSRSRSVKASTIEMTWNLQALHLSTCLDIWCETLYVTTNPLHL